MELRLALCSRVSRRSIVWFIVLLALVMLPAPSLAQHPRKTLGRWSMTRDWQIPGTHLALLHGPDTSSVIVALPSEGGGELAGRYFTWRWRSDTAVFHPPSHPLDRVEVTPPITFTNMFCAGHSAMANGRLLVTGGSEGVHPLGSWHASVFDPLKVPMDSLSWTPAPVMSYSRYYPTNVTMADGRVMVFSGSTYAHVLSFGGTDGSSFRNDLQLNAGLDSTLIPSTASATLPGTAPSARAYHGAVFDPGPPQDGSNTPGYPYLGRALIFGGRDNGGVLNGLWALTRDERRNRWSATSLSPTPDPTYDVPAPRQRPAVALEMIDPATAGSRMFVYGGADGSGQALGDCWELGLGQGGTTIGAWKRVISGGVLHPGRRVGHTIAAIIQGDVTRVIVVGGRLGSQTGALSDTVWALNIPDGGTPGWNVMRVGGPRRDGHVMVATDADTLVVFGGHGPTVMENDVWVFALNDSSWTQRTPTGPSGPPSARYLHAGGFDVAFQRLVIVGGATTLGPSNPTSDVWSLPIENALQPGPWRRDFASLPTGPRFGHAAFVDARIQNVARIPERYSPATNTWQSLGSLELYQPFYPFMYLLPNGKVFYAGPDSLTRLLDLNTMAWGADSIEADHQAGSAVLYRPWKVMKCGRTSGYHYLGNRFSEKIDLSVGSPAWSSAGDLGVGEERTEHNLTLLPDGNVLMTGGVQRQTPPQFPRRSARIWYPDLSGWSLPLAEEDSTRDYHSAATLLPDGRVLSAGGSSGMRLRTADLYEPPYLFDYEGNFAKRPPITSAPQEIFYGLNFEIETDTSNVILKVTLIRPGAVTHGYNQDQRFVDLTFTTYTSQHLNVSAPVDSFYAPPGDYLLFLVNNRGVPAIARWVRLKRSYGGGCPTVDLLTAGGWVEENTLLARSVDATVNVDSYRLKSAPLTERGRYTLRIRENGSDYTTLDEVGLGVVDHARNVRAFAMGDRVVVGTREPAFRVTTRTGQDITHLVNGSGTDHFVGQPGETLLVVMNPPHQAVVDLDPFEIDPGEKGGGGNPFSAGLEGAGAANADAVTLATTGILLQGRTEAGEWVTVRRPYPRQKFDECLIDTLDQGPARLVFVGRHSLRFVGRVNPVSADVPPRLTLAAARHSRLGDVRAAVAAAGGGTTVIGPGDTLVLEYDAPASVGDHDRDVFVVARGGYSSSPTLQQRASEPAPRRFSLEQNVPNPFAGATRIGFTLAERAEVALRVYDAQGREVRRLAHGLWPAGRHELLWNRRDGAGRAVRPGVYLYELVAGRNEARHKLVVLP